jgi:tetratricopeptide (TPR) repeat protein
MRVGKWLMLGAVVAGLLAPRASLGEQGEDPESLIRQGVELRRKGDNLRAVGYFERAYRLARTARSAAQLGLVEMAVEQYADANRYLTEALASEDPWVEKNRVTLEESRKSVRLHLGVAEVSGVSEGTLVRVDKKKAEPLPMDGQIWLAPGPVTLTFEVKGTAIEKRVSVIAGRKAVVSLELKPSAPPAGSSSPSHPPTSESRDEAQPNPGSTETSSMTVAPSPPTTSKASEPIRGTTIAGVVVGGTGVAAIVAGIVCRSIATTKFEAIEHASAKAPYDNADLNYRSYDRAGVGLIVGGSVAVATGVGFFVLGRFHHEQGTESATALTVSVGPSSASFGGRF